MAPSSALPIGARRVVSEMQPVAIDPSQTGSGLLNSVLALLAPPNPDENERYDEEILDLTVVGFLIVFVVSLLDNEKSLLSYSTHLDIPHKKMTILAPNQVTLAGKTAVLGSFEWQE